MKRIIVINGKGGAGKDTLCAFANAKYRTLNRSYKGNGFRCRMEWR